MSALQFAPTALQAGADTNSPNQYRLRGAGVSIDYFSRGGIPIMLVYKDSQRSLAFRGEQANVVPIANFGTCVTVTIETIAAAESTIATLLVPTVVLIPGRPARVKTAVIDVVHSLGVAGAGHRRCGSYRVRTLTGQACLGPLPV
ncbi:hypothetical protein [Mycobacterium sp.]|uniref:hypothetical protein n=1 Tax=Mycobacterium sp. TaxID=1785 RepID=UPI00121A98D7|nr:hypothetical protein [Mycobacterium sp.]TAM64732.1 MAG: hypothetical protein EPN51_23090 [Mycobacterium sp.]